MDHLSGTVLSGSVRRGRRRVLSAAELTEDEAAAITAAEIPAEHRYSLKDLK